MKGKTVTTQLWEDDYGWGDEHLKTENNDLKIEGRYTYKKLEIPDECNETYQKQRGGSEGDQIELYFKIPFEKETLGFKDGFARSLKLTTKEKLTEAYFAIEKEREQIKDSTTLKEEAPKPSTTHTVARNKTLSSIAPKYNVKWQDLAKENNIVAPWYLTIGQVLNLPNTASTSTSTTTNSTKEKAEKETYYQRIGTASLGSQVYLVVESANLQGKKANIEIFDNEKLLEKESDTAITILKEDTEVTKLENLTFNDKGQAKVKIKFRKKSDEDFKKQKDDEDPKIAKLYLKVTCKGDDKTHKVAFLDGKEFEVKYSCFCNRDLTEEEVKKIVIAMRKSETSVYKGANKDKLFFKYNCKIPEADKSFKRLTEELNSTFSKYNVQTCVKRIHFLAQTYWKADRFRTSLEYANGNGYNPSKHSDSKSMENTEAGDGPRYKRRGFMQLTWRKNYRLYFEYMLDKSKSVLENHKKKGITKEDLLKRSNNYHEKISDKLFFALNSAGWFWSEGKKADFTSKSHKKKYKEILGKSLNEIAEYGDKYTDMISKLVNGGSNGKSERKKYYEELRDNVFELKNKCSNYDKIIKKIIKFLITQILKSNI